MRGKYQAPRSERGRARLGMIGAVVVSLAAGGVAQASGTSGGTVSTSTAKVLRADLSSAVQVVGSIGYDGSYSIVNPAGSNAQQVTQAQDKVAVDEVTLSADQTSASDTDASNAASIDQAQTAVDADKAKQRADCAGLGVSSPACAQDGTQLAQAQAQLASAQLNATKATHQDQAKLAMDNLNLSDDQAALAAAQQTATNPGTTYTALPGVGQVLSQGQSLYAINGVPVPLFYGSTPAWRDFQLGMSEGPDVGELNQNLIALGFGSGLTQSDHFSQATANAVKHWQASFGAAQTGIVHLNEVVFEPNAIRITTVHATLGAAVSPGPVLDATSTTRIVAIALQVTQEYLVHPGDAVSVVLPDGQTTTTGHVRDISTVAVAPSSQQGSNNTPTVNVTLTLDNPADSGNLDQAPVNVNITDQSVQSVLAVPTTALLPLAGGGYAVEVVNPDGTHRLVPVTTGIFDDQAGLVQVSGAGLAAGQTVVAAA